MKRIYFSMILLFLFAGLVGCVTNSITLEQVLDGIRLELSEGDTYNSVTNDINLVVMDTIKSEIDVTWSSSNEDFASIQNDVVKITRTYNDDITITLIASFSFKGQIEAKPFTFIIIQLTDTEGPIITGTSNHTIKIGDPIPNYLLGVSASDSISNPSTLSFNDDMVNYSLPGVYNVYVIATDNKNNETQVTIVVEILALSVYDITFKDGNTVLETISLTEKETIDTPSVPVKDGYDFIGWYSDALFENAFVFNQLATSNLTLYAKFETVIIPDTIGPTIFGTTSFTYYVGDPIPNYLALVYAVDEVSGPVGVTVSDQLVNYTIEGAYVITFTASDEANNITNIQTQVLVQTKPLQTAIVESFDTIGAIESSYSNGTFTGVNGISWTYVGMRTDQILNGKSLTFGANASNSLKATIPGGIAAFSMSAKPVFTGAEPRNVALYINDTLIQTFGVTTAQLTYQVTGLNISGTYTLELRNTGGLRVIIDDVSITPNNEPLAVRLLNQDTNALTLPAAFMSNGTLNLPGVGTNGSTIVYSYAQPTNPNNSLINLVTGQVTMPQTNQVSISIKAVLSLESYTKEKIFTIKVGEGDPISLFEAKSISGAVKTKGIVSAVVIETNFIRLFLEDYTDAIQVLLPKQGYTVVAGEELIIKGNMVNGVLQEVTSVVSNGVKTIYLTEVTYEDLSFVESSLVIFVGLIQRDYTTGTLYVVTETGVIQVINKSSQTAPWINAKLGQEVVIIGNVVKENNQYVVWVTDVEDSEVRPFDEDLLFDFMVDILGLYSPQTVTKNMDLPTSEPFFNTTISWVSSQPSVVSNQGVFTKPSERTELTLTFTIQFTNRTLQGLIYVVAEGAPTLSNYYLSAQGLSGTTLKSELSRIIASAKSSSYDAAKEILTKADTVPGNTGLLYLIYDSRTTTAKWDGASTWNREHVWPDSKLGSAPTGEPHNLRASTVSVNSSRGNLAFVSGSGTYGRVGSGWYPGDTHKGDVARIILYMHVRWGLSISSSVIGDLNMFLRWHQEDPVDAFEINRNNVIYSYVNNRNPFIDHPEFATLIWGSVNTRQSVVKTVEALPFILTVEMVMLEPVHYYEPKNQFMKYIQ